MTQRNTVVEKPAPLSKPRLHALLMCGEHPDGPGGPAIVPQEYLAGETLMRALHIASARWIERCDQIRRPRAA